MKHKTFNGDFVAENEPPVTGVQLLCEILPLLQDFFIGEFAFGEQGIHYRMPNGQHFYITAREAQSE